MLPSGGRMNLIPKSSRIPNIGSTEFDNDPIVHIRLFHPMSSWQWFIVEYNEKDNLCFGLVCGHDVELGYFSLHELNSLSIKGLKVERDLYWVPMKLSILRNSLTAN